jgi:DNA-binding MarR family transcriptional regulator
MPVKTQETTPDLIAEDCIGVRARLLNRVVSRVCDDALRPLGLRTSQLNILVVAARKGLVRPAQVGSRLKAEISTVSRNVDRMRTRGWIEVIEDEKDARAHRLRVSAKGRRLIEKASPAWEAAQREVKNLLCQEEVAALVRAAEKVRHPPGLDR